VVFRVRRADMPTAVVAERPEIELLLCCARTRTDPANADRIRELLRGEVNWTFLLQEAGRHRVAPLLYWNLNAVCPEAVPQDILNELLNYFRINGRRNLLLTGELVRLLKALGTRGIPAVPFKGPALASLAYENLSLREFIDLDILVRKQDIPEVRDLMISTGYRLRNQISEAQEASFLESQREYTFENGDGTVVELHWAVLPKHFPFRFDGEDLWTRVVETRLGGSYALAFSTEDLLLFLCVHGSKHFWRRLAWVCDVAALVCAEDEIDWDGLLRRAVALGGERMLLLGLLLANDLLGLRLPDRILRRVRADSAVGALAADVQGWLFEQAETTAGILAKGDIEESRFHPFRVKVWERHQDKIRYCVSTALVPTTDDWALLPLPEPLFPLYYVLRPVRLAGRYGRRLLERIPRPRTLVG
jgi:hypothetical protein